MQQIMQQLQGGPITYDKLKSFYAASKQGQELIRLRLDEMRQKTSDKNAETAAKREENTARNIDSEIATRKANTDIKKAAVNRNAAGNLDADTVDLMADQYLAGDKSVFANIGRGQQGAKDIAALRRKIREKAEDQGLSGAEIAAKLAEFSGFTAGERAAGTRLAQVEMAGNEAYNMIGLAKQASDAVPRGKFLQLNQAEQYAKKSGSDPAYAKFVAANTSLVNAYARAISPTGQPHDSDKEHAREMLQTAQSQDAYNAVLDQMKAEIEAAKRAPGQVQAGMRASITGKEDTTQPAQTSAPAVGKVVNWADLK
jgi:hypothetical protein